MPDRPMLSAEEETALIAAWQDEGDHAARARLIEAHRPLAEKMARKMNGYGAPFDDLVQEALIGMMTALDRFDRARGHRFSTYARWWARSALGDAAVQDRGVSVPSGNSSTGRMLRQRSAVMALAAEHGSGPDAAAAVAKRWGVTERAARAFIDSAGYAVSSLNAPVPGADGDALGESLDLLPCPAATPEAAVSEALDGEAERDRLRDALASLPDRKREVVARRYLAEPRATLGEIAEDWRVSKERVRQVEVAALDALRRRLGAAPQPPAPPPKPRPNRKRGHGPAVRAKLDFVAEHEPRPEWPRARIAAALGINEKYLVVLVSRLRKAGRLPPHVPA